MSRVSICFLLFFLSGCITSTTLDEKKAEKRPLLSEKELFNEDVNSIHEIEQSSTLTSRAFLKAQKLVLSTGQNMCVIVGNKMPPRIVIRELIKRTNPPELGAKYEEYTLSENVAFAHEGQRYFYYNHARDIDFDEEDVRLVTRAENPIADLIIQDRNGKNKQKGLIDFQKGTSGLKLFFSDEE